MLHRERNSHSYFIFFSLQTRPAHKAFVTVATGQCLGVFGSCSTNVVPGGACVLCNLSPIVLVSKLSSGTRRSYVVTQSHLVNHLPVASYISRSWEFVGNGKFKKEKGRRADRPDVSEEGDGSSWTRGPIVVTCACACNVLYFEVEGAGSSWPLEYTTSLLIPSPQAAAAAPPHH